MKILKKDKSRTARDIAKSPAVLTEKANRTTSTSSLLPPPAKTHVNSREICPTARDKRRDEPEHQIETLPYLETHLPTFLGMPLELRHDIYTLLLHSPCEITLVPSLSPKDVKSSRSYKTKTYPIRITPSRSHLGLLTHTSKQLRREVHSFAAPFFKDERVPPEDRSGRSRKVANPIILSPAFGVVNRDTTVFRLLVLRSSGSPLFKFFHRVEEWQLQRYDVNLSREQIESLALWKKCLLLLSEENEKGDLEAVLAKSEELLGEGMWIRRCDDRLTNVRVSSWCLTYVSCRRMKARRVDVWFGGLLGWKVRNFEGRVGNG